MEQDSESVLAARVNESTIEIIKSTKTRTDSCSVISYKSAETIKAIRAYPCHFDLKENRLTKWTTGVVMENTHAHVASIN